MQMIRPAASSLRQAVLKAYVAATLGVPYQSLKGAFLRRVDGFWVAFRRGTSDEEVLAHSFDRDIFLSGVPEYRPQPGDTVLDVGAHIGDFALLMSRKIGNGKVYAIEPCGATYALLAVNVALNAAASIRPMRLALADHDGTCTLYHAPPGESWGDSTSHDYAGSREDVPCRRLATFFAEHGIERVDFAKLNCEGGEFGILMTADAKTLRRIRTMLVLYHCDFAQGASDAKLIAHLEAAGFTTTIRDRSEQRGWIVACQPAD